MIGPANDSGPDLPRIIDIDVDVVLRERAEYHCRAQATANGRAMSRPFQALPNQVSENILLGEVLGADDIARTGCRCQYRQRRNQDAAQEHHAARPDAKSHSRSEEHTSELQSLMRISYDVFCLKKKKNQQQTQIRKY